MAREKWHFRKMATEKEEYHQSESGILKQEAKQWPDDSITFDYWGHGWKNATPKDSNRLKNYDLWRFLENIEIYCACTKITCNYFREKTNNINTALNWFDALMEKVNHCNRNRKSILWLFVRANAVHERTIWIIKWFIGDSK